MTSQIITAPESQSIPEVSSDETPIVNEATIQTDTEDLVSIGIREADQKLGELGARFERLGEEQEGRHSRRRPRRGQRSAEEELFDLALDRTEDEFRPSEEMREIGQDIAEAKRWAVIHWSELVRAAERGISPDEARGMLEVLQTLQELVGLLKSDYKEAEESARDEWEILREKDRQVLINPEKGESTGWKTRTLDFRSAGTIEDDQALKAAERLAGIARRNAKRASEDFLAKQKAEGASPEKLVVLARIFVARDPVAELGVAYASGKIERSDFVSVRAVLTAESERKVPKKKAPRRKVRRDWEMEYALGNVSSKEFARSQGKFFSKKK